jgi:formyltetrahydrofolate deformylase
MDKNTFILSLSCKDNFGIVATIASFLTQHQAFIIESAQFSELPLQQFFMRVVFEVPTKHYSRLLQDFALIARSLNMEWSIQDRSYKPKVLLMVSKVSHCLNDILHKVHSNTLNITVPAIVSNHPTLQHIAQWYNIPFYHLPITKESKVSQEASLLNLIKKEHIDFVVLARYMQIFSASLCKSDQYSPFFFTQF